MNRGLDVITRGAYLGLALFALAAHALLLAGIVVPTWLPVLALLAGLGAAMRVPLPPSQHEPLATAPALLATAVVGTIAAALVFGSYHTPSRFWDGLVAWDVHAAFLAAQPTLEQDYFRSGDVYAHSVDYPILQPLLIALGDRAFGGNAGRLLFPCLYLLAVGTVASALRRAAVRPLVAAACALGLAVTPMLVNPTSGGADSGYAELLLATAVLGIAAGLVTQLPMQVAAGIVLAVFAKPEGLLYGLLPIAVAFIAANRRLFHASLCAWLLAAASWLTLQFGLNHAGAAPPASLWFQLAAAAAAALAVAWAADRLSIRPRTRLAAAALATLLLFLALPWLGGLLAPIGGTMSVYLGDQERAWQRLPRLLSILAGLVDQALVRLRFAFAWWCVLLVAFARWWRRDARPSEPAMLLAFGVLSMLVPFLLSPEEDLAHHLRSTMPRLLLHWLGAAWLFVGCEWGAASAGSGTPPPAGRAP